jgi:hypothetical protein
MMNMILRLVTSVSRFVLIRSPLLISEIFLLIPLVDCTNIVLPLNHYLFTYLIFKKAPVNILNIQLDHLLGSYRRSNRSL